MSDESRAILEKLCAERGESLAGLSRLLGRNDAYIQQFLRKGTPRRLPERERRVLARYFSIPESMLGAPEADPELDTGALVPVARVAARASAGPGALGHDEAARPYFAFDQRWLRAMTNSSASRLSVIRVEGDSMAPTLDDGDDILVDGGDAAARLRDGIYVLRMDDVLMVKRIARAPGQGRISVISDNPHYRSWDDLPMAAVQLVGRVVWTGRRVR